MKKNKVAIVYPFVPHYRKPVFSELSNGNGSFDYIFLADIDGADKTIKSTNLGEGFDLRRTKVLYWKNFIWQFGVTGVCIGREFSVVVFLGNPYFLSTWFYAVIARVFGKKVFFWTHGWLAKEAWPKRLLRNTFYSLSHGLLLYGDRAKKIGIDYGFPGDKLHAIYNSLDYNKQRAVRQCLESMRPSNECISKEVQSFAMYVACISRLTRECRFDLAIDALAILANEGYREIPLVLVGDGPEKNAIKEYGEAKNVKVFFMGALYEESIVGPLIYNARVVVSPGKVGLTAMHSLAYGTPVVTHCAFGAQGPEVESIVDGVTGSLFEKDNSQSLADALKYWLDKERVDAERQACISVIEDRYTPARQVELIEAALA